MLDKEVELQKMLNEIGKKVTKEILKNYDTKGEPVLVENIKYTKKGVFPEKYETIYGKIEVERNIYQNCNGGKTVCPMEHNARFILNSTPYFAKILAYKFINMSGLAVSNDLKETVGRKTDSTYARKIVDCIGNIAIENNEKSSLQLQESGKGNQVKSISVGLDSSSISIDNKKTKSQKKRIMTGTISLFDNYNHRIYTKYFAQNTSESGDAFLTKFKNEIDEIKKSYSNVNCYGRASQINFEDLKIVLIVLFLIMSTPICKN